MSNYGYVCANCGYEFDEEKRIIDDHGEKWDVCPNCGGDYEELEPCELCGELHIYDDLNNGVCNNCINEFKYDIETCYKVGELERASVDINCFLAAMYDPWEIERILYEHLQEHKKALKVLSNKKLDCSPFIEQDKDWFAENIVEVLKND